MNINKIDVIISYSGYLLKMTSNILILPIILSKLTTQEYGLWGIFLSLGAIINIIDLGFSPLITRFSTYAYSGCEKLVKKGVPNTQNNENPNYNLLFSILLVGKKIYMKLSILLGLILLIPGSAYIYYICITNSLNFINIVAAWIVYLIGVTISLYYIYVNSVLKGIGKVKELHIISIIEQLMYIILNAIFLCYFELGLIGLAFANVSATLLKRYLLNNILNRLIRKEYVEYDKACKDINNSYSEIYEIMKYNSVQVGSISIAQYIQTQGSTVLLSIFVDIKIIAAYNLSMQAINVINNVSSIPFQILLPKLSYLQVTNNLNALKKNLSMIMVYLYSTFILGGLFIVFFGDKIISILKSNTEILPKNLLILLIIYYFIDRHQQLATKFISVRNEQPHVKAYINSSILSLILTFLVLKVNLGIDGYIIVNICILLCYNAWKWPIQMYKQTELSLIRMIKITYNILLKKVYFNS